MPKSMSLTVPSWARATLAGFTSRCTTPWLCAYWSAFPTSVRIPMTSSGSSAVRSCRTSLRSIPSIFSMMMK